jgi:hypothetical protein
MASTSSPSTVSLASVQQPNPAVGFGSANTAYLDSLAGLPFTLERERAEYPNEATAVYVDRPASIATELTDEPLVNAQVVAKADGPVQQVVSILARAVVPVAIGFLILGLTKTKL